MIDENIIGSIKVKPAEKQAVWQTLHDLLGDKRNSKVTVDKLWDTMNGKKLIDNKQIMIKAIRDLHDTEKILFDDENNEIYLFN